MSTRIVCRSVIYDSRNKRLLLVRNVTANFWYAPGGAWDSGKEQLPTCAVRETKEETGLEVQILRFLYVRTFRPQGKPEQLELFWLARPITTRINKQHRDQFGLVQEAQWFTRRQLTFEHVFPDELKKRFWEEIKHKSPDQYLKG